MTFLNLITSSGDYVHAWMNLAPAFYCRMGVENTILNPFLFTFVKILIFIVQTLRMSITDQILMNAHVGFMTGKIFVPCASSALGARLRARVPASVGIVIV